MEWWTDRWFAHFLLSRNPLVAHKIEGRFTFPKDDHNLGYHIYNYQYAKYSRRDYVVLGFDLALKKLKELCLLPSFYYSACLSKHKRKTSVSLTCQIFDNTAFGPLKLPSSVYNIIYHMLFFQDCYNYKSIPTHTDQLRCGSSTPQAAGHSIHSHIQGWGPGEW